jgi:hypothetical protein
MSLPNQEREKRVLRQEAELAFAGQPSTANGVNQEIGIMWFVEENDNCG